MLAIFEYRLEVTEKALDANGHVNNVEYVRWMQDAAVGHSDQAGCTRETEALGGTWVARSHYIEYLQPAFAGDRIAVLTWVANFRKVRSLRKYKILRLDEAAPLARAETDWVYVDARTGKPRAIPASVAQRFVLVGPDGEP